MWLIWIWDSMETRRIAENVGISKATLTGVTNTLVTRGLVERVPSLVDRRLVELRLTPGGQELMTKLFPEFNTAEAELVAHLQPDDLHTLTDSLRSIVTSAEERAAD